MKKFMQKKIGLKGFTLAELLIVVAIIAVLVGVAVPIFTKKLEKSREETDIANLRSAKAAAAAMYLDDNENGGTYYFDAAAGVLVAANADGSAPSTIDPYGQGAEKNGGCDSFKLSTNPSDTTFYTATSDVRDEIIRVKISNVDEGTDYITMSWGNGEATSATVSFSANGGSGSVTPVSGEIGDTITLPSGSSMTPPADKTGFKNWNTAADGSGSAYAAGASYTLSATETLYAQWKGTGPMLSYGDNWFNSSTAGINKNAVTKVTFVDSGVPSGYTASWDASAAKDGSIMAYLTNGTEITVVGNGAGSIKANPYSSYMFKDFNYLGTIEGLDILDTSSVTNMSEMFNNAGQYVTTFSIDGLSGWDTSNVTNMSKMFHNAGHKASVFNFDLSSWNTSNVTDMSQMFYYTGTNGTTSYSLDLSGWSTSKVTNMYQMFGYAGQSATNWNIEGLSDWNTSNVTDMRGIFKMAGVNASTFVFDLSGWNTSKLTSMDEMFSMAGGNSAVWSIGDVSGWNTSNVTSMGSMFNNCGYNATTFNLNLSTWDLSKVTSTYNMFYSTAKKATTWSVSIPASNVTTGIANDTTHFYGSTTSTYASPASGKSFTLVP